MEQTVYVTNQNSNNVSVIDTATNTVTATVDVGRQPWGVAVSPDGKKVYVANYGSSTVSIIDAATNTVSATVPVGLNPVGVAVTPDGTKVYVTNYGSNNVSVIRHSHKHCYRYSECRKSALRSCIYTGWKKGICC